MYFFNSVKVYNYCTSKGNDDSPNMSRIVTKPTKWHVHPAKTRVNLGIRPVRSESSLSAWRKLGSLATHWAQSEDSYQTGRMPRLIWVFAGRTCHFVGFVMMRLISHTYVIYWIWYNENASVQILGLIRLNRANTRCHCPTIIPL